MNKAIMKSGLDKAARNPLKQKGSEVVKLFAEIDIDKANKDLVEERTTLINHIKAMQYIFPQSKFTAAILFRLAELYYDRASDAFDVKLRDYEKKMAEGRKGIIFPEFDMKDVIETYDLIITGYPKDEVAPSAFFYKALALQKLGKYDEANNALVELTKNYPESEFYVEANMNIARYYFEHPKMKGGTRVQTGGRNLPQSSLLSATILNSFRHYTALAGAITCRTSTMRRSPFSSTSWKRWPWIST